MTEPASIEVFFVDLDRYSDFLNSLEQRDPRLPSADLNRISDRAGNVPDDGLWRAARIALRVVLERHAGPISAREPFSIARGGRPHLERSSVRFSYAHSGRGVLIAVSRDGDVGVDLEAERDLRASTERRSLLEAAGEAIAPTRPLPAGRDDRTLQAWVRLEALAKLNGSGIGRLLTEAGVTGGSGAAEFPAVHHDVSVVDLAVPSGYFAAIAGRTLDATLRVRDFPETAFALDRFLNRLSAAES